MLPTAVRKLSYNPTARTLAQQLHIGHLARRLYCCLLAGNGKLSTSCLGTTAVFSTHNAKQLAFVDCVLTTERDVIRQILCRLKPGDTFLDVGCHYGVYSIIASYLVAGSGRVIAAEPHPQTLKILRENLVLNFCENVEVLTSAFSDSSGSLALSYNENGSHRQRSSDLPSTVHIVSAMAGNEVLCDVPTPAAIKIDVEDFYFDVVAKA
jgi:FkbM family methyltransferase